MEKITRKQVLVLLVAAVWSIGISAVIIQANASATVYNVTVKWTVPADYSLGISYPTALSGIEFEPAGQNFTGLGAKSQDDSPVVCAMNITNNGNAAIDIAANFTLGGMATNVTSFNLTTTFADQNMYFWLIANATTGQDIATALGSAAHVGYWAFTNGTRVDAGASTKTLYIESSAA
jgi:hypothetical protein